MCLKLYIFFYHDKVILYLRPAISFCFLEKNLKRSSCGGFNTAISNEGQFFFSIFPKKTLNNVL